MTKSKSTDGEAVGEARIDEAYAFLKDGGPMRVKVGGQWSVVTPHPASLLFPIVSREEFGALCADVAEHGFQQFPHLATPGATTASGFSYGGELWVIEGRHRVAAAYALNKSLSVEKFFGTDEEARVLVVSSNLHRRHLTKAQEALVVVETFLPIAKANAEERRRKGGAHGGSASAKASSASAEAVLRAADEASLMSGKLVSRASIERMQVITREDTPITHERVWTGAVISVLAAHNEARAEIEAREAEAKAAAKEASAKTPRRPKTWEVGPSLGKAIEVLSKDVQQLRHGVRPITDPERQRELLIEVQGLISEWFSLLDQDDDPRSVPAKPPAGEPF